MDDFGVCWKQFMLDAYNLFCDMISSGVKPDPITFMSFLLSSYESENLDQGKENCYLVRISWKLMCFQRSTYRYIIPSAGMWRASKIFKQWTIAVGVVFYILWSQVTCFFGNSNAVEFFQKLMENKMKPNSVLQVFY